jgi:DNA polymerase (family 10)
MTNRNVAAIFYEVAELLGIKGVQFKPLAYRRAAQSIEALPEDITGIYERGKLEEIPGVGSNIAAKIREIIETGNLAYLEKLRKELPEGVPELAGLEGIGPKKAIVLNRELGIRNIGELEAAAKAGKIRGLPGFGEKSERNILASIRMRQGAKGRFLLGEILPIAEDIVHRLSGLPAMGRISLAGSIRRRKETVGDVDILAASQEPAKVMEAFCMLPGIDRVVNRGPTKSTVVLASGVQVDLRVVEEEQYGAALQYFTGSKDHNIALRRRAIARNWRLNEYGLVDLQTGRMIAGREEREIYRMLDLPYIEPELREDVGEIEAALEGKLPDIVRPDAVQGDLHVHTDWSDGSHTLREMAEAARGMKYTYIAVCDHAGGMPFARGLSEKEIAEQQREIERLNRELDGIFVLSGTECTIGADGKLDLPDSTLKDLDVVVAGVHSGFKTAEQEMTERVIAAMHNDHVDIIAHPTGRIIQKREPLRLDLPRVFAAAAGLGVLLEINAFPSRLDLSDVNCRRAREAGARFSLGTDAHSRENLRYMALGVATARRGWLEAKDIVNTLPLKDLRTMLGS